jgi:hypothetical protein
MLETGVRALRILDLETGGTLLMSFKPRPLYPQYKLSRHSLNRGDVVRILKIVTYLT